MLLASQPAATSALPAVAEAIRTSGDARLGASQVSAAARQAVAAWALALAGDDEALIAMASEDTAHWLLHPPMKHWQVAPGARVTAIELRHLDATSGPPTLMLHVCFAGARLFDDKDRRDDADHETEFAASFQLAMSDAGEWRLAYGRVETLDEYYGYVFTSRDETAEEYLARTGSAMPQEAPGPSRVYRVVAGFAEHDERFGSSASAEVRRESAPTREEAEALVWPAVEEVTVAALGEGDWRPSLNWIDVIGLREPAAIIRQPGADSA